MSFLFHFLQPQPEPEEPKPWNDFYAYVNERFMKDREILPDHAEVSTWGDVCDARDAEVISVLRRSADLWTCATRTEPHEHGCDALYELLQIADVAAGSKGPAAAARALGELHAAGVDALFSSGAESSPQKGQDVCMLRLGEGGIGLPTGTYYQTHKAKYIRHIANVLLNVAHSETSADEAFRVEHAVCMSELSPADAHDATKTNNITRWEDLPPGLDWSQYVAGLGLKQVSTHRSRRAPPRQGGLRRSCASAS